jgi:DnaJ family protein C protein 9
MSRNALDAEDRFAEIVNAEIKAGRLSSTPRWKKDFGKSEKSKRRRKAQQEADEAEKLAEELGVAEKLKGGKKAGGKNKGDEGDEGDEDALRALIQQRGAGRMESLIAGIEAKYGNQSNGRGRKKRKSEPAVEAGTCSNTLHYFLRPHALIVPPQNRPKKSSQEYKPK